jgi:hypothetical protein
MEQYILTSIGIFKRGIALLEAGPVSSERVEIQEAETRLSRTAWLTPLILAVITSLIGTLVAAYPVLTDPSLSSIKQLLSPNAIAIFVGNLVVILSMLLIVRFRDRSEQPSRQSAAQRAMDFERDVGKVLNQSDAKVRMAPLGAGYDFEIDESGKRILLEVKAWSHRVPLALQRQTIDRIRASMKDLNADEAWIVVKDKTVVPHQIQDEKVRVLSLEELRNTLSWISDGK